MQWEPLRVKVCGELACFTRPEMKAQRVSYPIMTPSAARGILESIFWKKEFQWNVLQIHVLLPIQYISLLRNEVAFGSQNEMKPIVADERDHRDQRHTLALRNVAYVIVADVLPVSKVDQDRAKYRDQFRRRIQRGQCFTRPYLGCREFAAEFRPVTGNEQPLPTSQRLGLMLRDIDYDSSTSFGGLSRGSPIFFDAELVNGVLHVPPIVP